MHREEVRPGRKGKKGAKMRATSWRLVLCRQRESWKFAVTAVNCKRKPLLGPSVGMLGSRECLEYQFSGQPVPRVP